MDLQALASQLSAKGSPLTLDSADTSLPPELQAFLKTMPQPKVTLIPAGNIDPVGNTLTVSGASTDAWPIDGLASTTATLSAVTLKITDVTPPAFAMSATATIPLGTLKPAVTIASGAGPPANPWTLALAADVTGATPGDVLALTMPDGTPFVTPPKLGVLDLPLTLPAGHFAMTFYPGTGYEALFTFEIDAPTVRWSLVDGVAELDGLSLEGLVKTDSVSVALVGHLKIEGVPVDLGVGLAGAETWLAFVSAPKGTTFPGIADLAKWIAGGGGQSQSSAVTTGFSDLKLNQSHFDAAIQGVTLAFDPFAAKLVYLEVDSKLTIAAVPLDVSFRLPDLTIAGGLDGPPVHVTDVLKAAGLAVDHLPVNTTISFVGFSAQPSQSAYLLQLQLDDVAQAGPLKLAEVGLVLSYVGGTVSGLFECQLELGTISELELQAEYDSTNGWVFSGGTPDGAELAIDDLLIPLLDQFGVTDVPEPIRSLKLTQVGVDYATATGKFDFTATGTFAAYDTQVTLAAGIHVTPDSAGAKGYTYEFDGTLKAGTVEFDVVFEKGDKATTFVASYSHDPTQPPLSLHDLVAGLSPDLAKDVPGDITIDLKDAKLARTVAGTTTTVALALDLGATIGLNELPLIGDKLPAGATVEVQNLMVAYASGAVSADTIKSAINPLLPNTVTGFPATGLGGGVALQADLKLGDAQQVLSLGLPAQAAPPARPSPTQPGGAAGPPAPTRAAGAPRALGNTGPTRSAPTAKWFDVQRQLGVVQLKRVGVLYENGALLFGVDAAIALGPIGIAVDGLAVGSSLSKWSPAFDIAGLAVQFDQSPLEIAGALLKVPAAQLEPGYVRQFDGSLVIAAAALKIAAIGSYAQPASGEPSLFVFAQLERPLGGPPALFVTGLMGGVGFNRALQIPAQDEVLGFPLLVLNAPPTPGSTAPPQTLDDVLKVIEGEKPATPTGTPKKWIQPSPGEYWVAAGLEFTSFELVQTRAVLIAEFGHELQFALLGLSTMQLPQPSESSETYAYVELELEAVLQPAKGFFGLTAILSPNSYVITPACKLTGGFAFFVWFAPSDNAGQFVITIGGYHPAFKPKPYYPQVPRLGFHWAVSDDVSIGGDAYFALTPSCAMAGGRLEALFHDGDLRAWFEAAADVLFSWRPFHFEADISVEIGVSYRLNLLVCHKTISLSLGASVSMWGPPTGGTVTVHLWCVSFTVDFGADPSSGSQDALLWPQFAELLPDDDRVVGFQPTSGLYKTADDKASSSGKKWIVRATGFAFTSESAVPASALRYGEAPTKPLPSPPASGPADFDAAAIPIRPMNLTGVDAAHWLAVRKGSATATPIDISEWTLDKRERSMPASLWSQPPQDFQQTPSQPSADVVDHQLVGYTVTAPRPAIGATRGPVGIGAIEYDWLPAGTLGIAPADAASADYSPTADDTSVGLIQGIGNVAGRDLLYQALAGAHVYAGAHGPLAQMGTDATHLFAGAPMTEATPA